MSIFLNFMQSVNFRKLVLNSFNRKYMILKNFLQKICFLIPRLLVYSLFTIRQGKFSSNLQNQFKTPRNQTYLFIMVL